MGLPGLGDYGQGEPGSRGRASQSGTEAGVSLCRAGTGALVVPAWGSVWPPPRQALRLLARGSGLDGGPWGAAGSRWRFLEWQGRGWRWGVEGVTLESPQKASWRGIAVTCPVFPLSPSGGLAVEGYPGCVPGPPWEERLPGAGGRPGALRDPHLPLRGVHLPVRGSALPCRLRGRVVPGQASWQVSGWGSPGGWVQAGPVGASWSRDMSQRLSFLQSRGQFCVSP